MAVRASLLEVNDLQNGIRHCKKELENLQLFEMGQTISRTEKIQLAEQRRKINVNLHFFAACVAELKRENIIFTVIYISLFVMVILLRCVVFSDQRMKALEDHEAPLHKGV